MKSNSNSKCPNTAEVIVPWGGKIIKGCKHHGRNMSYLAQAMGSVIEIRELPPNNDKCEFQDDLGIK